MPAPAADFQINGPLKQFTDWLNGLLYLRDGSTPSLWLNLISICVIILVMFALRWIVVRLITRAMNQAAEARTKAKLLENSAGRRLADAGLIALSERRRQRAQAIGSILRSIASFVILGTGILMVLDKLGLPLGPVLASASVLGLAVGFGAQNLVKDFLSGVFMIMEDQFGVGDYLDLDRTRGEVLDVGLRVTQLRDRDGTVWYVRNGEITRVGNRHQGYARATVDIKVAYDDDLQHVLRVVKQTALDVQDGDQVGDLVLENAPVIRIHDVTGDAVTVRIRLRTVPMKHNKVASALRLRLKEAFDREGLRIPATPEPGGEAALSMQPPAQRSGG